MTAEIIEGDCLAVLPTLADASVDAVICDPPYELKFMSRKWDGTGVAVRAETWAEVLRVLKPGGHLLAFGGTRTHHRMTCAIEDAGFEIRDCLMWLYGTGFPKGKGCLKPAWEPIILARRTGPKVLPLGIDACRVPGVPPSAAGRWPPNLILTHHPDCERIGVKRVKGTNPPSGISRKETSGYRGGWGDRKAFDYAAPDGTETVEAWNCVDGCPAVEMDQQSGNRVGTHGGGVNRQSRKRQSQFGMTAGTCRKDGRGGASRFFPTFAFEADDFAPFLYCAKASRKERDEGLEGMAEVPCGTMQDDAYRWERDGKGNPINLATRRRNTHPTVKPVQLCSWLAKLVCPPGGLVLDPFAGSGSTGVAALREGFRFIGIEQSPEYCAITRARLDKAAADRPLLAPA